MKLYHSPGACSLGILLLLEEIGAPFEVVITNLKTGAHRSADFLARNPKGKVPALERADGSILTEFPVIAYWLARRFPQADLLPRDLDAAVRVMELTENIVSGMHMRGTVFANLPQKFVSDPAAQAELLAHGQAVVAEGYDRLDAQLGSQEYLFGGFTIADAAAFYLLSWSDRVGAPVPAQVETYFKRLNARPSAKRALECGI